MYVLLVYLQKKYSTQIKLFQLDLSNPKKILTFAKQKLVPIKKIDSFISLTGYIKSADFDHLFCHSAAENWSWNLKKNSAREKRVIFPKKHISLYGSHFSSRILRDFRGIGSQNWIRESIPRIGCYGSRAEPRKRGGRPLRGASGIDTCGKNATGIDSLGCRIQISQKVGILEIL